MVTVCIYFYYYLFHFVFVLKVILPPKRRRVKNAAFHVINTLGMYTK